MLVGVIGMLVVVVDSGGFVGDGCNLVLVVVVILVGAV